MKQSFAMLSKDERKLFAQLSSPQKIQDYLDTLPINFEEQGETLYSPRNVIRYKKAHCFEGALFALSVLNYHEIKSYILDLETTLDDEAHVVTLFKINSKWGAISKTNHSALQYRDPIYKSVRELAMSYFHEYFLNSNGKKTLRSYAMIAPNALKSGWITDEQDLWYIDEHCNHVKKTQLVTPKDIMQLRRATTIEKKAGSVVAWKQNKKR